MAGGVKADCAANLMEHSYALNTARLALVALCRHSMFHQFSAKTVECVRQGSICEVDARFGQGPLGQLPSSRTLSRTSAKGRKQISILACERCAIRAAHER